MRVETNFDKENSFRESPVELWLGSSHQLEFVLSIEEKGAVDLVGTKAYNLMKLYHAGFPVPVGFCITTKAFDYFLDFNTISPCQDEDGEKMQKTIMEALMPPSLVEIITDAYHQYLHGKPCAVRSSSPLEDDVHASFAGQFETILHVTDRDSLLQAIKKCWASLWKENVIQYRKAMGGKEGHPPMAVLIQEMIPSQSSGVVFTGEQIVVESVWGLGTSLVGGTVTPDRYILDRDGKTLLDEHIASKSTAYYLREQGGIIEKSVPDQLQNQTVLNAETRNHLCDLCIRVEQLFGCSQDIEWAIVDGNIIILQARPITVSASPEIWSRANIGEMQPGYVTYLSRIPENRPDFYVQSLKPLLECFNITEEIPDLTFTKYIYGHIYANMTTTYETVGKIPGLSPDIIAQSIGLSNEESSGLTPGLLEMIRMLPGALRVMKFMIDLPKKAQEVMPHSLELISHINTMNLEEYTLHELDTLVWEVYDRNAEVVPIHVCTFMAIMAFYNIVEKILHSIGEPKETAIALISGLEGMCTSQMGIEIWKLAQTASQSPLVTEIISSEEKDILQTLKDHAESTHFLEQFEKFMEDYGNRCSQELELSVPRWKETPEIVLTMVENTLHSNAPNPLTQIEIQKTHRLETQEAILKQLSKNPAEKILFSKILEKIQHYLLVREELKTTWVKGNTAMRMIYLTMARKLTKKGALSTPHDIFFLKMTEVSDVIGGTLPYDEIPPLIAQRRVEKETCENLDVPDEIIGEPPPLEELKKTIQGGTHFEGIGCSPGIVTGKARVIKDIHQACDIEKGEILVIPVTDPGWSPLFVAASGIVVELGGTLSHGIIIAREYGVPTIVGIKNATDIFHTGQLITIDGGKGIVSVEDEPHD